MSEKKHIDRLFQEKFKDFEASPKEQVWKNIEQELKGKKSRKPYLAPLWYKIAGVAALLGILFLAGGLLFNNSTEINVVNSNDKEAEEKIQISPENSIVNQADPNNEVGVENKINSAKRKETSQQENENGIENTNKTQLVSQEASTEKENQATTISSKTAITSNNSKTKITKNTTPNKEEKSISKSAKSQPKTRLALLKNQEGRLENNESSIAKNEVINQQDGIVSNQETTSKKVAPLEEKENAGSNDAKEKKSLLQVAAAKEETEKEPDTFVVDASGESNKWQVKPFAAPIYYNSFGGENALDPSLAQNKSEGEITMSYGLNFSYKISERLKIRSGVSQVSMNYNTQNIAFVPTVANPSALNNVSYTSEAVNLQIINKAANVANVSSEYAGRNPLTAGTLQQQLGFVEVPLELEYALIDKKFGLSIIGGASTLFLNQNNIAIQSVNGTTNIGEASNLNEVSFSTNIGLGLDYEISDNFEINLEPMFKYQVNTFNQNANNFRPYYLGIYTGIGFKF